MNMELLKSLDVDIDEIERIINGYCSGQRNIVVTGEFSSGKSSFINCFLNRRAFLPYGKTECTPILIDISEGAEGTMEVRKKDGNVFEEELSNDNIIKYAKYVEGAENEVVSLAIPLKKTGLPEKTHLIDTPGTNTILKEHEEITKYIIKRADAVLYLFNKVVSNTDIEHINNILQYTSNIIYILTHSDEIDTKTNQRYTKERIGELIEEARKEISAGANLDPEDLILCGVGSEYGFENRSEIEEIKNLITHFINSQSNKQRKREAQRKIEKVLQKSLDDFLLKKELLSKQKAMSENEIENKIKLFKREQINYEKKHNNRIEDINRMMLQREEFCRSEFSRMLDEEQRTILSLISEGDVSQKIIEKQLEKLNTEISANMRKIIEESIVFVTKDAYDSVNSGLKEIIGDFDIAVPIILAAPEIKELDDSRISIRLIGIEKQIEENLRKLETIKENSNEEEKIEIEKKIRACELQKQNVADKLLQLGVYHPEFIQDEIEGGKSAGKITGRIIGEVADVALLLWNPAGSAANVAKGTTGAAKVISTTDKAKDLATITRYIKNAAREVSKTGKEVSENKDKMKKVVTTIKKVDDGRREIIERVQENAIEESEDGVTLSTMLDMLSIGHWTEKLGGVIGETINPSTTVYIENMENKDLYESKRTEIIDESNRLSNELYNLRCRLNEVDDFGKQLRIEKEIKEKNRALEDKKHELEEMKSRAEEKNINEQLQQHFRTLFDEYERSQLEKGVVLIQVIFNKAKEDIIERLTFDYYEKLDYYKETIENLCNDTLSETEEMIVCEDNINTLRQSLSEVGMWLE